MHVDTALNLLLSASNIQNFFPRKYHHRESVTGNGAPLNEPVQRIRLMNVAVEVHTSHLGIFCITNFIKASLFRKYSAVC